MVLAAYMPVVTTPARKSMTLMPPDSNGTTMLRTKSGLGSLADDGAGASEGTAAALGELAAGPGAALVALPVGPDGPSAQVTDGEGDGDENAPWAASAAMTAAAIVATAPMIATRTVRSLLSFFGHCV